MAVCLYMCIQAAQAEDASSIVGSAQNRAIQDISSSSNVKQVQEIINYQGTNLPEVGYKDGNMSDAAREKAKDSFAGQLVETGFIKRGEVGLSKDDKMFRKAEEVSKHPERYVDWISGKYEDCENKEANEVFANEEQVCDEFNNAEYKGAQEGGFKYQCVKQKEVIKTSCDQSLIVKFEEYEEGCNAITFTPFRIGNTSVIGVDNDVVIEHLFPIKKRGGAYEDNLVFAKFDVNNIDDVKELYIESLGFGSEIRVGINQSIVLEKEINGSIDTTIDLKSYIKAGINWISFTTQLDFFKAKPLSVRIKYKKTCLRGHEQWNESCKIVGGVS